MKALLLHPDRDFDLQQTLPPNEQDLSRDLELETLFRAMAGEDGFLFEVARKVFLSGLQNDVGTILYRQAVLRDCLENPTVVRELYALTGEVMEKRREHWFGVFDRHPSVILHGALGLLQMLMGMLRRLRSLAEEHARRFQSHGFACLFAMLEQELSEEYLAHVQDHLKELKFRDGVLLSAKLGKGNQGDHYVLLKPAHGKQGWLSRLLGKTPSHTVYIDDRDENGARALSELRNRGVNRVANALAQSAEHVLGFFTTLRTELAFYVGCLNLHDRLTVMEEPTCFPRPGPAGEGRCSFDGLYDVCLALRMGQKVVGNTANADSKRLVIITGANRGGKSSFLRSLGLAQLMMQCGMFVAAESFATELCAGLFTHFKREEDAAMESGKLDEELRRMSDIADHLAHHSLVLFNESFAATNEREGSEIARQIVSALLEKHIKIVFVTHLYEFARSFFDRPRDNVLFLRAERLADGTRTFRLIAGEPLDTSYGQDLYRKIFAAAPEEVTVLY